MAKIRHIAIATKDPAATAEFYKKAFGFTEIRRSKDFTNGGGVFLTDGTLGIAILYFTWDQLGKGLDYTGLHHFGVAVDEVDDWTEHLEKMGAELLVHSTDEAAKLIAAVPSAADFEVKFKGPEGLVFDISHKSWPGAEPVSDEEKKIPVREAEKVAS